MEIDAELVQAFRRARSERGLSDEVAADLPDRLQDCYGQAQAAWPGVRCPPADFGRALAARLPEEAGTDLSRVHSADLYLACAVILGDTVAHGAFARVLEAQCQRAAATRGVPELAGELRQQLSERLLLPADGRHKLLEYSAAGPLAAYLRIAAVRLALNLRRDDPARRQQTLDEGAAAALGAGGDAETRYLRERHQGEFQSALREAFAALPPEQRNVVRMHYAGGLSGQSIARMLQVDRSTVVRWLASARVGLLQETRRRLRDQLRLSPSEVESLIALLRSQLDVSMRTLLGESPGA